MPPWPGIRVPGVLGARGPLEHRLGEVAGLRRERGQRPEQEGVGRCLAQADQHQPDDDRRRDDAPDQPCVRLRRRDVGQEPFPPEPAADQEGPGVVGPYREEQEQDPAPFGADGRQRCVGRDVGCRVAEAHDEREEADIQGPEDRRHPRPESVARVRPRERGDGHEDDPDRDEQEATALEHARERRIEDDGQGDRHARAAVARTDRSAAAGRTPRERPGPS